MTVRGFLIAFFFIGVAVVLVPALVFLFTGILALGNSYDVNAAIVSVLVLAVSITAATYGLALATKKFDKPVARLVDAIDQISQGDPNPDLPIACPAEFDLIRNALGNSAGQTSMVVSQLSSLSSQVATSTTKAGASIGEVKNSFKDASETAVRILESLENLGQDVRAVSEEVGALAARMDNNAAQVSEMDMAIGYVSDIVGSLNTAIEQAIESAKQDGESVLSVKKSVTDMMAISVTAQNELRGITDGVKRIQSDTGDAAAILGNLASETGRLSTAIKDVITGSDAAHASNERILAVTANLQSRVDRVDDVIEVIGNLAERTKLLSINASIIASEAGEHGRAFAVVATEIKELAQSTAGAISEISRVVEGLKEGFHETVQSIQKGQEDVGHGVRLARNAVNLIAAIPERVQEIGVCHTEIARGAERWAQQGAQVEETIGKLKATFDHANQSMTLQEAGTDEHFASLKNLVATSNQVLGTIQANTETAGRASRLVDMATGEIRVFKDRLRKHAARLESVVTTYDQMMNIVETNRERLDVLTTDISDLNRYALFLGGDFRKLGPAE
ncbi:MAG: methyl-accepting chemotaxis protein [Myxococcota bacterium]|nr:methyl-accepting chemotaxis protein [Myxococcota bacterium]